MRIAHLLRKCDPSEWGGTEMALKRLFDSLRQQGVGTVVFCPRLEHQPTEEPLLRCGHDVHRFKAFVPVLGISPERKRQLVSIGGNLMSFDLVARLWREQDLSVIHTHTLGRIGGIALTIARQRQLPFVVTIHGGVLDLPEQIKKSFNAPVNGGWEWGKLFGILFQSHALFRDADAIITCNETEAALLREKYPGKRILVQPHGVPLELYRHDHRQTALSSFPQIQGRQVLLCLGRIDPTKNQKWVIEQAPHVFERHPKAFLVLAGPCTDEPYGAQLQETIQRSGLRDRILLTGSLPPDDQRLIGLLQQAELLILPSLSETFGLVILEAWAAGTAVLSSSTSGARALIQHGHNGWLFDLDAPETFHRSLDFALSEPQLSRELGNRGRKQVERHHSLEALATRVKKLYQELIEETECAT